MRNLSERSVRIVTWNINGWRSAERRGLHDWLQTESPDIICLQETRLNKEQVCSMRPFANGYTAYFSSGDRPGYSGTAILTKTPPIRVGGSGIESLDNEGRTLLAEYTDFVVVNSYIPNGNRNENRLQYKHIFLRDLSALIAKLSTLNKKVFLCGDFNTAHTILDTSQPEQRVSKKSGFLCSERKLLDEIVNCGWRDSFRSLYPTKEAAFTWWASHANSKERNSGWRFDYIFLPESTTTHLSNAWMDASVNISDHCPFSVEIKNLRVDLSNSATTEYHYEHIFCSTSLCMK